MTVAVFTGKSFADDDEHVWACLLNNLIASAPEDQFLLLAPKNIALFQANKNLSIEKAPAAPVVLKAIRERVWLSRQLAMHKPQVLVSTGWQPEKATNITLVLLLSDDAIRKQLVKQKKPSERFIASVQNAQVIITASQHYNELLRSRMPELAGRISVFYPAIANDFSPATIEIKQTVKERYTLGKEYFLYAGSIGPDHGIINLLKAFSLFKKRQHSNMKLVLSGTDQWPKDGFNKKLSTYKFRQDIIVLPSLPDPELALLTAAAYACIDPASTPGFSLFQMQALQTATPFISTNAQSEPASASVQYGGSTDELMAEKMKWMYKEENMRALSIEQAADIRAATANAATAASIWSAIDEAVTNR